VEKPEVEIINLVSEEDLAEGVAPGMGGGNASMEDDWM
jgi:hypothetical protein